MRTLLALAVALVMVTPPLTHAQDAPSLAPPNVAAPVQAPTTKADGYVDMRMLESKVNANEARSVSNENRIASLEQKVAECCGSPTVSAPQPTVSAPIVYQDEVVRVQAPTPPPRVVKRKKYVQVAAPQQQTVYQDEIVYVPQTRVSAPVPAPQPVYTPPMQNYTVSAPIVNPQPYVQPQPVSYDPCATGTCAMPQTVSYTVSAPVQQTNYVRAPAGKVQTGGRRLGSNLPWNRPKVSTGSGTAAW